MMVFDVTLKLSMFDGQAIRRLSTRNYLANEPPGSKITREKMN